MTEDQLKKIINEIRTEQQISPFISDESIINYVKEGIYDINDSSGFEIDYSTDLIARSLLKNYVLYANHKRLAEFKELYTPDYAKLQAKYYDHTDIS